jgi:hypothetical protein
MSRPGASFEITGVAMAAARRKAGGLQWDNLDSIASPQLPAKTLG